MQKRLLQHAAAQMNLGAAIQMPAAQVPYLLKYLRQRRISLLSVKTHFRNAPMVAQKSSAYSMGSPLS